MSVRTVGSIVALAAAVVLIASCGVAPQQWQPIDAATASSTSSGATSAAVQETSPADARAGDLSSGSDAGTSSYSVSPSTPDSASGSPNMTLFSSLAPTATDTPRANPPAASSVVPATEIARVLGTLAVKGRAPKTGYTRAQFGPAWSDDVTVDGGHNGCDTRNDILRRDLTGLAIKADTGGCTVLTGTLHDAYTGKTIAFTRGQATSGAVQIDHVVALLDAWQKGAQQLSAAQRQNMANDPLNLQAVDGPTNEQKGAGDAATWLPPNKAYRCTYVSRQIEVKAKYHLWVTQAEKDAILRVLATCGAGVPSTAAVSSVSSKPPMTTFAAKPPTGTLNPPASTAKPPVSTVKPPMTTSAAKPPSTTAAPKPVGCHPLSSAGNCYKPGQLCAKRDHGVTGVAGSGKAIKCVDGNGTWRWVAA
ncbi:MAG: DUF1524 domain-containing protein [Actinobacteria bacterium]|nr:DUF1524 domain-containing protein [Actinomycetota bacterium]